MQPLVIGIITAVVTSAFVIAIVLIIKRGAEHHMATERRLRDDEQRLRALQRLLEQSRAHERAGNEVASNAIMGALARNLLGPDAERPFLEANERIRKLAEEAIREDLEKRGLLEYKGEVETRPTQCRVCGTAGVPAAIIQCARCGMTHHQDCWEYFGYCARYGCGHTKAVPGADES